MSVRYRCMTTSVHICLTVVTGFLIVILYRNQWQRSSSTETLCAREVHRMVLGGLNVHILYQKMLYTSCMFWWNEDKFLKILYVWFQPQVTFLRVRSGSNQELFAPYPTTLTSKLQRRWTCLQQIWIIYQKKIPETSKIRKNSGNPKKTEILVFRISKKSIW